MRKTNRSLDKCLDMSLWPEARFGDVPPDARSYGIMKIIISLFELRGIHCWSVNPIYGGGVCVHITHSIGNRCSGLYISTPNGVTGVHCQSTINGQAMREYHDNFIEILNFINFHMDYINEQNQRGD